MSEKILKTIKSSSLIRINIGDKVLYGNQIVTIKDFVLSPNGVNDTKLICIIYVQKENGNMICATSNHFNPLDDELYEEFYPTPHMFTLK